MIGSFRIRNEKNGGAWCPKAQISSEVREYLEINLMRNHLITLTETQGRFGNGQGQEYAEGFLVEYWRASLNKWIIYNENGTKDEEEGEEEKEKKKEKEEEKEEQEKEERRRRGGGEEKRDGGGGGEGEGGGDRGGGWRRREEEEMEEEERRREGGRGGGEGEGG
ncbi:hypothetical protein WDU94_000653 [Cyamophila willieti]